MVRVLGPQHRDTLTTRGNVASWTGEVGNAEGALAMFEALLPDKVMVLGRDHPDTLKTRGHVARWKGEAGDDADARARFEA